MTSKIITTYESKKYFIGSEFTTNNKDLFKIIGKSIKKSYYWIKFEDEFSYIKESHIGNIRSGEIKNPYSRTIYNIGYIGVGDYKSKKSGKNTKTYDIWHKMIARCYNGENKNYENVTVCSKWHNFQNFAKWYKENSVNNFDMDKDLLQKDIKNKIYSPEVCIFIPRELNRLIAYRKLDNKHTGVINNGYGYIANINDFFTKKRVYIGTFETRELAYSGYLEFRVKYVKKFKEYLKEKYNMNDYILSFVD